VQLRSDCLNILDQTNMLLDQQQLSDALKMICKEKNCDKIMTGCPRCVDCISETISVSINNKEDRQHGAI
jgi:hypothetical protein